MLGDLKRDVCRANRALVEQGLVRLTFGNVSGIDPKRQHIVIKPSGVPYAELEPERMVVVDMSGKVIEGDLRPSTDTPTHLLLYRHYETIGGITHVHSRYATMFAQARREIPKLDPSAMPAVLVAGHGPFSWGRDAAESVENAVALEAIAEMAFGTRLIDAHAPDLEPHVLRKHHERKHGKNAYYGQDGTDR
jgi:L-ribulose-5-phosphate 4-epimerase